MLIASRAVGVAAETGAPLPEVPVLKPLHDMGVVFREGKLVMIAGPSSGGKSMLAQYVVDEFKVPALYIAADMDEDECLSRLISKRSGIPSDEVREDMLAYRWFLEDCKISFCFQENPSVDDIYLELDAYVEMWDAWPKVLVVDNLMDVDAGDESYQGQLFIMQELRNIAKRTGACVIVLAHTRGEQGADQSKPQSKDKILNKVDQKPQLIFTLGREDDLFRIAVVKDRNSKATDPTAKRFITIRWHGDTASFSSIDDDWLRYNGGTP